MLRQKPTVMPVRKQQGKFSHARPVGFSASSRWSESLRGLAHVAAGEDCGGLGGCRTPASYKDWRWGFAGRHCRCQPWSLSDNDDQGCKLVDAEQTAEAITVEAGLSFLGLGVDPTLSTWGGMLPAGNPSLRLHAHLAVLPALLIMLAVLGFNAMGDAIRDILDRRMLNRLRGGRTT